MAENEKFFTALEAQHLPLSFNDGFGRPDVAYIWGDLSPHGENLFEICGGSLIFSDLIVGPKEAVEAFARDAKPQVDEIMLQEIEDADEDDKPVAAFALWEGADGEYSVAGTFVLAADNFLGSLMEDLSMIYAPRNLFMIANSSSDNSPCKAFSEIPTGEAFTVAAQEALLRAMSEEHAREITSSTHEEYAQLRDAIHRMNARKESAQLENVTQKPITTKKSTL